MRQEEREREWREVGTKRKSYQYKNDRWRKKDVEMKEVHESHQKDRDKCIETQLEEWEAEKQEGYRLYQACQSQASERMSELLRSKAERRADEDRLRW